VRGSPAIRARARARAAARARGMTLLEILVSLAILAMIALLIYGAFDSMSRGKRGESIRAERSRQGRGAVLRMARELSSSYLSLHIPTNPSLVTRKTAFVAVNSAQSDRVDFTAFAHRRTEASAKDSDQAEVGYFVVKDPDKPGKMDLVRREQTPIDFDPRRGGIVNVIAEDVESFDLRFLDPASGLWTENWDTTQGATGQLDRLPLEIEIKLVLANVPASVDKIFITKVVLPMQQPLSFGVPR
jgi:general secretion pathway protein J